MMSLNYYNNIIKTAAESAGVETGEMRDTELHRDGDEYEISFHTEWMSYTLYIDLEGAAVGFFSEPVAEHSYAETEAEIIPLHLEAV